MGMRVCWLLSLIWLNCLAMDPPPKSKPCPKSCSEIITITSIADFVIKAIELSSSEKVLVVFDIDDVLFRTEQRISTPHQQKYNSVFLQLGSEFWQAMQLAKVSSGASIYEPQQFLEPPCSQQAPLKYRETCIPVQLASWVNHLTTITDVISLTMRNITNRANLRRFGVHLCNQNNIIDLTLSQIESLNSHGSDYSENIIYTNHNPKGEPLLDFYQSSKIEYDTVLFVDNIYNNVESVVNTLSSNGVNVLGFWLRSGAIGECHIVEPKECKAHAFYHGIDENDDQDSNDPWPDIN